MARMYRDGLDAIRRQFLDKRRRLDGRADQVRRDASDVLTKDALDNLARARAKLEVDLDDLDALLDADEPLLGYERLIRATHQRVDELRAERRRLRPVWRAAKVLGGLALAVGAMAFVGAQRQQAQLDEALAAKAKACRDALDCAERGLCDAERVLRFLRCSATTDADCAASRACRDLGRCHAVEGLCEATTEADCAGSRACEMLGHCALDDGTCLPSRDEHCADKAACAQSGACRASYRGCVAEERSDCAELCASEGRCTPNGAACFAEKEDCKGSTVCRELGACTARDGRCVAEDAPACDEIRCDAYGLCTARGGQCVVASDLDCHESDLCARQGLCVARDGRCVADETSCFAWPGCGELGLCDLEDGRCVNASAPTGTSAAL